MPRIAIVLGAAALAVLPLTSCLHEVSKCSTCPPELSASIGVQVPARPPMSTFGLDSVEVRVDDRPWLTVKQGRTGAIEGLAAGTHTVSIRRWFSGFDLVTTSSLELKIPLDRGERRVIIPLDLPLIVWSPIPSPVGLCGAVPGGPAAGRVV